MGMFDYVVGVPEVVCECGANVTGWQSKDGPCELAKVHFTRVGRFYTSCESCDRLHEFYDSAAPGEDWSAPAAGRGIGGYDHTATTREERSKQ